MYIGKYNNNNNNNNNNRKKKPFCGFSRPIIIFINVDFPFINKLNNN
jgi:hypothetical protein